jgi:hypothetical protein
MSAGILGGALVGWLIVADGGLSHSKVLVIAAFALAGAVVSTFIGSQLLVARLRPYFQRVLEERKAELAHFR